MTWVDFFKQKIKEISQGIFPKEVKKIRVIATTSTDSIIACSFLTKTLFYLSYNFSCSFCKKITNSLINELLSDSTDLIFLINPQTSLENLTKITNKKLIIIESNSEEISEKITLISPQQFSKNLEIPASSLTYLLCKEFYPQISEFSYLLPIPFFETDLEIPEKLLAEAILSKKLKVGQGITLLISQTLPIYKSIANTLCPYLPGVSGSEDNAVQFMIENDIPIRENTGYKTLEDLNEEQTKKLLTAIILKRLGSDKNPNLTIGDTYALVSEDDNSIIKDLKGFHYLIKSCIAYSKPSLALNICLNPKQKSKAYELVNNSQVILVNAMEDYLLNKKIKTIEGKNISFINMGTELDYKLLSMFTDIINHSNFLSSKFIAVLAINPGGEILAQIEASSQKNKHLIALLITEFQKLMKSNNELTNNFAVIRVSQDNEQSLIDNLSLASDSIKQKQIKDNEQTKPLQQAANMKPYQ